MMEKQCWWFFLRLSFNILSKKSHKALFVGLEWLEFLYLECLWLFLEGMKQQGWPLTLLSRGSGLFLIRMERSRVRFLLPPNIFHESLPSKIICCQSPQKKEYKQRVKLTLAVLPRAITGLSKHSQWQKAQLPKLSPSKSNLKVNCAGQHIIVFQVRYQE